MSYAGGRKEAVVEVPLIMPKALLPLFRRVSVSAGRFGLRDGRSSQRGGLYFTAAVEDSLR